MAHLYSDRPVSMPNKTWTTGVTELYAMRFTSRSHDDRIRYVQNTRMSTCVLASKKVACSSITTEAKEIRQHQ